MPLSLWTHVSFFGRDLFNCVFLCFQNCSNPAVGGDCVLAVNKTGVHFLSLKTAVSEATELCVSLVRAKRELSS